MKKFLLLTIVALIAGRSSGYAQFSRYIIRLKDKTGTPFSINNPDAYLTNRSIDRRARYNIPVDQTDLPITPRYIDSIRLSGNVSIINVSKWLNQVCIQTTDAAALIKINSFPFVLNTSAVGARIAGIHQPKNKLPDPANNPLTTVIARPQNPANFYQYGDAYNQVHIHNGEFLHNNGFRGEGMQMAIIDAGFYHYQTLPTFDSVRNNNQVLGTWDFVANESSVNEDHAHGMNCFSTIAANLPGSFVGTAPKASFYLYRTEDPNSEYPVEEQNWAAAAEKADSLGVDVCSVSLGYNTFTNSLFDYTYADMNGHTSMIARAAKLAVKKGMLVVTAAGNEGNNTWHYITTPADADSVLTVGAVTTTGDPAFFSSYGPSSDGRIKPDVAAVGLPAIVADQTTGQPSPNTGTSFACPIMAGISSCLWQAFPEVNNMAIIRVLQQSSDKTLAPDDRKGYGIPDVKKAFITLVKRYYHQQINIINDCKATIQWDVKTAAGMSCTIERKLSTGGNFIAISTQNSTGPFAARHFSYTDDLSSISAGIAITYRVKMNIGTDSSFYLDSATVHYQQTCSTTVINERVAVSPNPVTDKLFVLVARNNPVKVSVMIHSSTGQKIYSIYDQPVTGTYTFTIPLEEVNRGVYYVTVYIDHKKVLTKRILKG